MTSNNTDTGQQALNLSVNEGGTDEALVPAPTEPRRRPPLPAVPNEEDLIEAIEEEERIYDKVRSGSGSGSVNSGTSQNADQLLRSFQGLSEEEQASLFQKLKLERTQSLYPTTMITEELERIQDANSEVEETTDVLSHHLGTLQEQKDDLEKASNLLLKRASSSNKEVSISRDLNKAKIREIQIKRVKAEMDKVVKGQIKNLEEIDRILKKSKNLTQRESDVNVIYAQVHNGKTTTGSKKVSYAQTQEEADEDSIDLFQDATDDLTEPSGWESEENAAMQNRKKKKKKDRQDSSQTSSARGERGGGDPSDPSSDPDTDQGEGEKDNKKKERKWGSTTKGSSKYEKVLFALEEAIENATEVLEDEESAKIKLNNTMDDLKSCLKMAKQTRIDHDPPSDRIRRTMNTKIKETSDLVNEVADQIENFNKDETLRKMLPQGSWPKWYGDHEDFLDFITTMKAHLPALKTDKLQLSTLKDHMPGPQMKEWIRNNLTGVSSLNEAFEILQDKFGKIVKHLPKKLKELDHLKATQGCPTDPILEHENVTELLNYSRTCVQYGARSKINNLFLDLYKDLLSKDTKFNVLNPLIRREGWDQEEGPPFAEDFIVFLVDVQNNLESLPEVREKLEKDLERKKNTKKDLNEQKNSRFNNLNNSYRQDSHNGPPPCMLCRNKEHRTLSCYILKRASTPEQRKKLFEDKGSCVKCLRKLDPSKNHNCPPDTFRKFHCREHRVNVAICGCKPPFYKNQKGSTGISSEGKVTNNSQTLKLNNTMDGATHTALIFEIVEYVNDKGETFSVLQVYDNGNSNSSMDYKKCNEIYGHKPFTHTLNIDNFAHGVAKTRGNRRTVKFKTVRGIEEITIFTCQNLVQKYDQSSFDVPETWMKEYNLRKHPTTPAGVATSVVGMDTPHLMPELLKISADGVALYRSNITGKLLLAGKTREQGRPFRNNSMRMTIRPVEDLNNQDITNYISTDGVESSRLLKCSRCVLMTSKCQECKKAHKPVPREQAEWEESVKVNIEYRPGDKRYYAKYIYNQELENLLENKEAALRMSKIFERKIDDSGITDAINKAYKKYRQTGVIMLDSEKPLDPNLKVSYITPTFALASSDFKNTKVRMCMNSGFKIRETEVSLNDSQVAGPQYLNDLHGVLTRWRSYKCVAYADISSCYHQVYSCDEDRALRHIWVKPSMFGKENGEEWCTAYCTTCQFGDKLAGAMCTFCIADCGDRFMKPENSKMMKSNIIMDDIMIGQKNLQSLKESVQDINEGLNQGSLSVKDWTMSGDQKESFKYLSYITDPKEDTISLRTNLNWSKIKRGARTGPSLTKPEDIDEYMKIYPLTKKAIASVVMGCTHDPLGLADPYKNNFKFLFQRISGQNLDWKDEVDDDVKKEMKKALTTFLNMGDFKVPRQCVYGDAQEIDFIFYFDGSLSGCGVSTVVKNVFADKEPILRVLKNKSKITGADCKTAPRSELMACLLASRVYDVLNVELKEFLDEFTGKVKFQFVGDSTIVLNQIKNESFKFKMWCQSKIQEIQELTKKTDQITPEWYHCRSEDNVADILTRPYHGQGLPWQNDLPDIELKPLSFTEDVAELPEVDKKSLKINVMRMDLEEDVTLTDIALYGIYNNSMKNQQEEIDEEDDSVIHKIMTKKSNYFRAKNIIARILDMKRRKVDKIDNMSQAQVDAENLIFKHYQEKKGDYVKKFQGHIYTKTEEDGLVVLRGRKTPRGKTSMKLVPKGTLLFQRITHAYHNMHKYDSAQATSTQLIKDGYYVPGLVQRLQALQKKCPACRRRKLKTDPPEMGRLAGKRLIPSKPFTYCQMDLLGPVYVRTFTKQRNLREVESLRKAWILVGICDYARLISLSMVESLSMDHLLLAIKAHFARYGKSLRIESDLGSNFKAVAKHFNEEPDEETVKDGDIQQLTQELKSVGCNMVQRCPRTPYLQGSAEHAVKMTKKALKCYKSKLSSFTWINLLEHTMVILNRRPIGAKLTGEVLTPSDVNSIFTGTDEMIEVDPKQGDLPRYTQQVAELLQEFQERWLASYYKTLLRQKKWIEKNAILEKNDLVLILDLPNKHQYPTLGRVIHIKQDGGDVQRYFSIQYKKNTEGVLKTVQRTPTSLVLILKESEDQTVDKFDVFDDPDNTTLPPQPAIVDPKPPAVDPEPVTDVVEPVADVPEAVVADPEPVADVPEAVDADPVPVADVPEPVPVSEPEPAQKKVVKPNEPRRSGRLRVKYQRGDDIIENI